jgi:hypothetical protein
LIVEVPRRGGTSADGTERAPTSLSALIDLPDVPLDAAVRSYLPSLELVVADLAGPELTREALRASDAEPVSAIPRPRISAAAEALPEPEKETFMTAAQEWMLEGLEKGLQQGREEGRQEGREAGERAALASMLLMQTRLRFRDVPSDVTTRI